MTDITVADARQERPDYPIDRTCPHRLPDGYAALRAQGPVCEVKLYDGRPMWAIVGHAAARAILSDPRTSSSRSHENLMFPVPFPALGALNEARPLDTALLATDPPHHSARRRLFAPWFTVRRIATLREAVQTVVDDRLDTILAQGPPAELVSDFALPIPSMVICQLLGVPYEDHEFFEEQTRRRLDPVNGDAMLLLNGYLDRLVETKATRPGTTPRGLLDDLLETHVKDGNLDRFGLVMFAQELLIGGHDTTANMLSLSVLTLLQHPEQLAALKADDSLMAGAVEELLRSLSIVASLSRVATEDIELAGRTIRAGDGILISPMAASHDESVFEDAEEFDIHRTNLHHVAFGYGRHQCIGQNLARLEMEVALRSLFARIPALRLAVPAEQIVIRQGMLAGLVALPVEW
ncbi:cytochrome P450 [Phytohabitans houttuyneae]|uniref:Cytochrome P450 n=1 Tax=Phytohabitans houttuyneae TaxID=1076126 RepID=A0A6V8KJK8_9ACTN|nr:cytochrome P450 [Phytohabitans houttuyneae]GFJ81897.1 cytochrome P450 [Phytohabitans houttuyneae]